jgi:hypothetical protein
LRSRKRQTHFISHSKFLFPTTSNNNHAIMSFKSQINASVGWNWNEGAVDSGRVDYVKQLLDGGGIYAADAAWNAKEQLLAAGGSTTLDLAALQNTILGGAHTVALAAVKAVLIVNHGGGGTLLVGGAAGNEWSAPFASPGDQAAVPAESSWLLCNGKSGWTVNATHRNLKLAAVGEDVVYSIVVVGQLA